ncbi:MAG: HEAT repeat domain-containing protein [Vicinamibacterales bacterium]
MTLRSLSATVVIIGLAGTALFAIQRAPSQPSLSKAIDQLVSFDFATRTEAARIVRRSAAADAVPALSGAALTHKDGYVRYRALVLLAGYGDASAGSTMLKLLADPNDRIRAVTYGWFEHHPSPEIVPALIAALAREQSEFVRPALTRALAASHSTPAARGALEPLIMRGEDYFRGSVIEALGDYQAAWAREAIGSVAMLVGPLQDDAIVALGKIGSRDSLALLATLQKAARPETQPSLAVATCLITKDCVSHIDYLTKTIAYAAADQQYQALLRSASFALGALARRGERQALTVLLDAGEPSRDPARAAIALAVGNVALRNPGIVLDVLESRKSLDQAATLLQDAFDMLSEDFEEERFFVEIRRAYWAAAEGSPRRRVAQALIDKLEF